MSISRIESDATGIHIIGAGKDVSWNIVNDLRLQDPDNNKNAIVLKDIIQTDLDIVQRVRDLPNDEPTKKMSDAELTAEYGERAFYRGQGNNKELVFREIEVVDMVWSADQGRYLPSLRVTRGGGK